MRGRSNSRSWKTLSTERKRLWDEWHAEFGEVIRRGRTDQGSQSGNGRAPSPAPPLPPVTRREVAAHDHFGIPAGVTASVRETGGDPLVLLDTILKPARKSSY